MNFEISKSVRLYVKGQKEAHLEIIAPCPDNDSPSIIVQTPNEESKNWFGRVYLDLTVAEARTFGEELVKFANVIDKEKQ